MKNILLTSVLAISGLCLSSCGGGISNSYKDGYMYAYEIVCAGAQLTCNPGDYTASDIYDPQCDHSWTLAGSDNEEEWQAGCDAGFNAFKAGDPPAY